MLSSYTLVARWPPGESEAWLSLCVIKGEDSSPVPLEVFIPLCALCYLGGLGSQGTELDGSYTLGRTASD